MNVNKVIYKFPLSITGEQYVTLPRVRQILEIQLQLGTPMLWAAVNPDTTSEEVKIRCFGTGHREVQPDDSYIGTVQTGGYVWHFFEAKS